MINIKILWYKLVILVESLINWVIFFESISEELKIGRESLVKIGLDEDKYSLFIYWFLSNEGREIEFGLYWVSFFPKLKSPALFWRI